MRVFVWTDVDLDGVGSYMAMCWLYGETLPYKISKVSRIGEEFQKWYEKNKDEYDKIYILDIDCSNEIEFVDHKNVVIIDHHQTHNDKKDVYKQAKAIIKIYPSTVKLIYDVFKDKFKLTNPQKVLISLINDYDSYELKYSHSLYLNWLFWEMRGDRLTKFYTAFNDGFIGFNKFQKHIIHSFERKIKRIVKECNKFKGSIKFNNTSYSCIGTYISEGINEVLHNIIEEYDVDIAFAYNEVTNTISFRRSDKCDIQINELATKLCNGGGHAAAAGGYVTPQFTEFTKTLQEI